MTTQEFSNEFDILYNNVMSNQAPGLDEYEKSVFLTKAQSEVIIAYFEAAGNISGTGYDQSLKRQYDFSSLVTTETLSELSNDTRFDDRSYLFEAPSDLFLSINEQITDSAGRKYTVVPISYAEYALKMARPYGYPIKRQAWRLITGRTTSGTLIYEIVGRFSGDITFNMRYVKQPQPIILVDLDEVQEGLSIDGVSVVTECELPDELHHDILQRAVELAKASYETSSSKSAGTLQNMLGLGSKSLTGIGAADTNRKQ